MNARAACTAGVCIAGVGCRASASVNDILAVIGQALKRDGLQPANLTALACIPARGEHPAVLAAAARFNLPLVVADPATLAAVAGLCLTRSEASLAATGLPSASEAAALATARALDTNARLAGPRSAGPMATCAIACSPAVLDHLDQQ